MRISTAAVAVLSVVTMHAGAEELAQKPVDFEAQIQPILSRRCFECHGDGELVEGGLRLTNARSAFVRGDSGHFPIVANDPSSSTLWQRISTSDPDLRMPPEGDPLNPAERVLIERWIQEGATWPQQEVFRHWAYQPPVRHRLPADRSGWSRNPIDRFVLAAMQQRGMHPSEEAEPARLVRRVYLDLIGLPPAIEEVDLFLQDPSDAAYRRIVERLLASPRYGEKWARHWLDLARYSDSNGYQADQIREMWAFRDWVIDAMNVDMPFDQFTVEQLAGDLLAEPTLAQRIATGFHRATTCNVEAGVDPEENRTNQVLDRVNTTSSVWLGSTIECAQCHNHKYDPFSQQEYYELFSFFNNTPIEVEQASEGSVQFNFYGPKLELPSKEEAAAMRATLNQQKQQLANRIDALQGNIPESDRKDHKVLTQLRKQLKTLEDQWSATAPATTLVMQELSTMRQTNIFRRGSFRDPGVSVQANVPRVLNGFHRELPRNRLGLAKWLVDPSNPLTARVTVNRWWSILFGRGVVTTTADFGTRGARPSHPQLLDWLALELQQSGWSMKQIHRLIVTCSTYRQSSRRSPEGKAIDPENIWLARGPRTRLPAELLRDNALTISGLLDHEMNGPPVYPPQPAGLWHQVGRNEPIYDTDTDNDRFRRGIYVVWRRAAPYPSFTTFDAPDRMTCVAQRPKTNTPLQALTMLNDQAHIEMARAMAARIVTESQGRSLPSQLEYAMRLALARHPRQRELEVLAELYQTELDKLRADDGAVQDIVGNGGPLPTSTPTDTAAWAAWFCVCNAILNLDETICKP